MTFEDEAACKPHYTVDCCKCADRAGYLRGLRAAFEVADSHDCGGMDDIVCRGQNCAMCVRGEIRALIERAEKGGE